MPDEPRPGDLLRIDGRASVQFSGDRALVFRVVSVDPKPTYHGWIWLSGYVLDGCGQTVARRDVFVQLAGVRLIREPSAIRARPVRERGHDRARGRRAGAYHINT